MHDLRDDDFDDAVLLPWRGARVGFAYLDADAALDDFARGACAFVLKVAVDGPGEGRDADDEAGEGDRVDVALGRWCAVERLQSRLYVAGELVAEIDGEPPCCGAGSVGDGVVYSHPAFSCRRGDVRMWLRTADGIGAPVTVRQHASAAPTPSLAASRARSPGPDRVAGCGNSSK